MLLKKLILLLVILIGLGQVSIAKQPLSKSVHETTVEKEVDLEPYMKDLQTTIRSNWFPPAYNKSKKLVVYFRIGKDGTLLSNKLLVSSGNRKLDKSAIKAVKNSAPFKPFPKEYKGNEVEINFSFDYNVLFREIPY